jgi:16S rRNA (cytidine1402-2'-O)-methyltransferase
MTGSDKKNIETKIRKNGILYLIPVNIADCSSDIFLPNHNIEIIRNIRIFFAENVRTARRFISGLRIIPDMNSLEFEVLDKDTGEDVLHQMTGKLLTGYDAGLLSEAGSPGIADPGSKLVGLAHRSQIKVVPLVGPSSILLALIASGFNGQNFAFNGYLPIEESARSNRIRELEKKMYKENQTQIFIETPYRNDKMIGSLIKILHPDTLLCIAADLTGPREYIRTMPLRLWKNENIMLNKIPAVFLIDRPETKSFKSKMS